MRFNMSEEERDSFVCSICKGEFDYESCATKCHRCGDLICDSCAVTCYHCEEYFCPTCIEECERCSNYICAECEIECSDCGCRLCTACAAGCDSCNHWVCHRCRHPCWTCGNYYCNDCVNYCDRCYRWYCSGCGCACPLEIDLEDYSYNPEVLDHDTKADWKFVKQPWENTTFLGIELEMSFPREKFAEMARITSKRLKGLCFWKYDGSIDQGENSIGPGGELVITPCTYLSHRKLNWKKILGSLRSEGAISHDAETCGLHIHVNKDNISDKDIRKLKTFFVKNAAFIQKFSKRSEWSLRRWAEIPPEDVLPMWLKQDYRTDRYICLNFTADTLEFRVFRGTLNHDRFRACLQFVEAIIDFVKSHSMAAISSNRALEYFKGFNRQRFCLLNKYIESIGY